MKEHIKNYSLCSVTQSFERRSNPPLCGVPVLCDMSLFMPLVYFVVCNKYTLAKYFVH